MSKWSGKNIFLVIIFVCMCLFRATLPRLTFPHISQDLAKRLQREASLTYTGDDSNKETDEDLGDDLGGFNSDSNDDDGAASDNENDGALVVAGTDDTASTATPTAAPRPKKVVKKAPSAVPKKKKGPPPPPPPPKKKQVKFNPQSSFSDGNTIWGGETSPTSGDGNTTSSSFSSFSLSSYSTKPTYSILDGVVRIQSFPFYGRIPELKILQTSLQRISHPSLNNPSEVVWLTGPIGVGKTTLLQRALD